MATKRKAKWKNKRIVLIKKANNLIESRYKFDIWETRIFLSVLSQIRRDDEEFQSYRIRYKDIIKIFGLKSGDSYAFLRDGARSLMEKKFVVNYEEKGAKREKLYHILRSVDVLKDGEEGKGASTNNEYIDVVVEDMMRPLLLQLQKNFTAYDLQNVVKLGVYPIRVYELLKQYQRIGNRTLTVVEMKRMFEVEDKYRLFGDFNRWVIKPAIKEINKHTDLMVTDVEKIYEGRSVNALKFIFREKNEEELSEVRGEDIQQLKLDLATEKREKEKEEIKIEVPLSEKDKRFDRFHKDVVQRFGVTPSTFLHLLDKYTNDDVSKAIRVTNRAKYNQQIKSNIAGFFVKALQDGFTDEKEEKQKRNEEKKKLELVINEKMADLAARKNTAINNKIKEITERDPGITKRAIKSLREDDVIGGFISMMERRSGKKLTVEDFRQDRELVNAVKSKIIELSKKDFAKMLSAFEKEQKEIKALWNK